jgi:folate-binding protein YgfZ
LGNWQFAIEVNQRFVRYNQYHMGLTALLTSLRAQAPNSLQPADIREYRGAEALSRFSDSGQEFEAMLNGCAVFDLGFRARISLKGADRVRWANGMVTNNIRDLAVGHGVYTFLLNPQGRILGEMNVFNMGDTLEVETDRNQVEKILATFDHYIIMDDVEVANLSEAWTMLGVAGPTARTNLNTAGIQVPELEPLQACVPKCSCDCECVECTVIRGDDPVSESYEIWLAPKDVLKTWNALVAAGATPAGSEALEMHRIAAGIPLFGIDVRERDLPQETEQARALNFNKGCYVGQEIVERIRSRGNVHRKFTSFLFEGVANASVGAKVSSGEKEVGEITSAATLPFPSGEQTVALGYIRREVATPGREVMIAGSKAKVANPPLENMVAPSLQSAVLQKA